MDEALVKHFDAVLRPLLPNRVVIQVIRAANDAAILHIDYASPLNGRPNRRSAALNLFFPHETVIKYLRSSISERATADQGLQTYTRHILEHFEWEHEVSAREVPPAQTVFIDDDVLFQ